MTDYTVAEVERALLPLVGGYFDDMTEEEEAISETASDNDLTWGELQYTLRGGWREDPLKAVKFIEIRSEQAPIEFVADKGGGEGEGEERWVVIKVGDQFFKKTGYYMSHEGSTFDGELTEVEAVERTVTFYEKKAGK